MADNKTCKKFNRRNVLKSLGATGFALGAGSSELSGSAEATEKRIDVEVKELPTDSVLAQNKLGEVTDQLLDILASEGHLAKNSVNEFPTYPLSDSSRPGGIERLQVNGSNEQFLFHKHTNNGRLEIHIGKSVTAAFHYKDSSKKNRISCQK